MCSVGEEYMEEQGASKFMEPKRKFKFAGCKCNKCKEENPCIVLRNKYGYCKTCFLNSVTHKFRSYLGAIRISYTNDKILILHKGGHQTTAMLHLLRTGLNQSQYKKIKIQPIVLYIENLFHLTVNERKQVLKEIEEEVASFDFKLYVVSFSEYLLNNKVHFTTDCCNTIMDNDKDVVNAIINKNSTPTVKSEILTIFEKQLITKAAEELDCKWVFTTKVAFNIASQILSDLCLGRKSMESFNARKNIAADDSQSNIKILAPFIDIEIKELAMYNFYNNLAPVTFYKENFNPFLSVQNLMKKFVEDLQISYPATITTIVKTGEKLTNKDKLVNSRCSLCKIPKDNDTSKINSAQSTHFSHWVSTQTPNYDISSTDRYRKLYEDFMQNKNSSEYCYRCSTIIKYIIE